MRPFFLRNLSIRRVGLLSVYLVSFLILLFALLIIDQEYSNYKKEVAKIQHDIDVSDEQKKRILEQKKEEFKIKKMRYVIGIGGLTLFMFITIYAIIRTIAYFLEHEFNIFIRQFGEAAKNHKHLDESEFGFIESKSVVKNANAMVAEIQERELELAELNRDLEKRVLQKTKKLQHLVKAQDEFIKKSIHEINTPLSIILTNIDLLKMQDSANQHLTNIESASKIIHNLFNDLSYLVKKDRVEYTKERINLSKFLRQRLEFFAELANVNALHIVTNIEENIEVVFNETKLQRVIDNNLSNIIKYSYSHSGVFISLNAEGEEALLSFKNSSDTIEDCEEIFREYYRENDVKGGYGIGLSIVKEICDENGVAVTLDSKDNITLFTYRFKVANEDTTT